MSKKFYGSGRTLPQEELTKALRQQQQSNTNLRTASSYSPSETRMSTRQKSKSKVTFKESPIHHRSKSNGSARGGSILTNNFRTKTNQREGEPTFNYT